MKTLIGFIPVVLGILILTVYIFFDFNFSGGEKGILLVYVWLGFSFIFLIIYFIKPMKNMKIVLRIFSSILCSVLIIFSFLYLLSFWL